MHCSQCYWETRQTGCQKKSCGFYHILPRNIQGLFLPPTSDVQVQSDVTHQMPLTIKIYLLDEDDEEEELDDITTEERVQTQEEEAEEKAIIAVCRSAGDIFKISACEEKEHHEEETPGGGDNTKQKPPDLGEKKALAPPYEKGHGGQKPPENHTAPVGTSESTTGKNPPGPHDDPPSKPERSANWKGSQHYYRGGYKKDGQRWRKRYWYTDYDQYQADKGYYDNYQPCRKPYPKGWRKTLMYEEKYTEDSKPACQGRSDDHQQADNRRHDNYRPARKPPGNGWRRTYSNEEKNFEYYQFNHKKRSRENKKSIARHYEQDQKQTDNYRPPKEPSSRGRRKTDFNLETNNENYKPFRKPFTETFRKQKAIEKNTGSNQNLGNASSKEKNKDSTSMSKTQSAQRQPD
ncbi:uncharacterized protein LOC142664454 isoform X2 [Rhinoderma darwinii]|uniref:uncharacterized protein LOC142664454 isoform X2 n=1 Tax=Rhinoderma darwinii TaxID=43563 RepID=UPI003F671CCA